MLFLNLTILCKVLSLFDIFLISIVPTQLAMTLCRPNADHDPLYLQVSDQGASLAGGGGHALGSVKLTLGTGAFLNINTGHVPHASAKGGWVRWGVEV